MIFSLSSLTFIFHLSRRFCLSMPALLYQVSQQTLTPTTAMTPRSDSFHRTCSEKGLSLFIAAEISFFVSVVSVAIMDYSRVCAEFAVIATVTYWSDFRTKLKPLLIGFFSLLLAEIYVRRDGMAYLAFEVFSLCIRTFSLPAAKCLLSRPSLTVDNNANVA